MGQEHPMIVAIVEKELTVLPNSDLLHTKNFPRDKKLSLGHTEVSSVQDA